MSTSLNDRVSLFCECFGDTMEAADKLFSCSDVINVSIYNEDRLAAMASLIPILASDYNAHGFYIYGVCVAPDMRGRGLFRDIMQTSETEAKKRGAKYVCLIPADNGLANTYQKMGYTIPVLQRFDSSGASGIEISSKEFRDFAKSDSSEETRQRGLLKILDINGFNPQNQKLCFLDDMGDV